MYVQVLGDIVTAQEMDKAQAVATGDEHELDKKYCTLNADLQPLPASSAEFQVHIQLLHHGVQFDDGVIVGNFCLSR